MPVIVPRKVVPIIEAKPEDHTETTLSLDQVSAMLAERDAAWSQQIHAITQAFSGALKAIGAQPQAPAKGWEFKVAYRSNGAIETIIATPRSAQPIG